MAERRTSYEIYWEIFVYCKTPRTFTAIIGRCDLNSKTGQEYLGFLVSRGFLAVEKEREKSTYIATDRAAEYTTLFTQLYQGLFDKGPTFRV
jgi:predicted transcriptional regulator